MGRPVGARSWLQRIVCLALVACVLANAAAAAAAWHRYQLLLAVPPQSSTYSTDALMTAEMWFDNLMGWRNAILVASALLLIAWLDSMRGMADGIWPEGQRRSRVWLIFGWWLPIANLFVPKMFVNDLWAAARPGHRRGHPLLLLWWGSILAAFGSSGAMLRVHNGTHAAQACDQMRQVMVCDALFTIAACLTLVIVRRLSNMLTQAAQSAPRPTAHPQGVQGSLAAT